jgi:hypothetical protein
MPTTQNFKLHFLTLKDNIKQISKLIKMDNEYDFAYVNAQTRL